MGVPGTLGEMCNPSAVLDFYSLQNGNNALLLLSGDEERINPINEEKTFRPSDGSGTAPPPLTARTGLFICNAQRVFKNDLAMCVEGEVWPLYYYLYYAAYF